MVGGGVWLGEGFGWETFYGLEKLEMKIFERQTCADVLRLSMLFGEWGYAITILRSFGAERGRCWTKKHAGSSMGSGLLIFSTRSYASVEEESLVRGPWEGWWNPELLRMSRRSGGVGLNGRLFVSGLPAMWTSQIIPMKPARGERRRRRVLTCS